MPGFCFQVRAWISRLAVNDPVFEKRGIPARVHETSYRFLFFWLLSAKMGTKIVRVATFSIYNPYARKKDFTLNGKQ
ncbi:MAG: hypothetical protein MIO93_14815, partial [ANME-2 cluster archaeon]|nr:hypothetical protein [ANME-2 cluster archaeon]